MGDQRNRSTADYPLHQAVFTGDLKQVSALIRLNDVDISQQDQFGNTPLHLAVMLGRKDCVQLLLMHGAPVETPVNNGGWSTLDEAVSYGDRQTIMVLLRKRREQWKETMTKKRGHLLEVMKSMGDFYAELKWGFNTWMPLLPDLLPGDLCRLTKCGCLLRIDYTLAEMTSFFRWKRGNASILVDTRQPADSDTIRLDNRAKTFYKVKKDQSSFEEEVSYLLSGEICQVQAQTDKASFVREQSGWFVKEDRTETVGKHTGDFYHLTGLVFNAIKRSEHMSAEDLSKKAAFVDSVTKGNIPDDLVQQLSHRDSLKPPPSCQLTWEEYLNSPADSPPCLARPIVSKKSKQQLKASVAVSEDLPLDVNKILDILEVVTPMKHFSDLDNFFKSNLPPGFPIRVEIPIFPTVTLAFSCGKFEYRDDLDEKLFIVPEDYTEDGGTPS